MDDEADILNLGKIFLEKINPQLTIVTCNSSSKALELLDDKSFDAIVCDYQMPIINGLELLEKIRFKDKDVPFIIFTGRGAESVAMKALNLGANRYFQKTVSNLQSQYELLAQAISQEIHFRDSKIKTRRLERVLKAIRNVNQLIVRENNLEQLLQGICDRLIETKGCITCCIFYSREEKSIFRMASIEKIQIEPVDSFIEDLNRNNCYKSLKTGIEALKNHDYTFTQHNCSCLLGKRDYRLFARELNFSGNTYGIIAISLDPYIKLDDEEKSLFLELTSDISYALYNLEIKEKRRIMQRALIDKAEVLRFAPVGVGSFNSDYKILVVNKKFEEITGFNLKDLKEKKFYDLFSNASDFDKIREKIKSNPITTLDTQWITKNAQIITISLLVSKTSNGRAYTFTIIDLSEVVKTREQERFLRTLLAHESKNAVHTIKGYISLIDRTKLNPTEQEYLTNVVKKIEENQRLFNKIFTVAEEQTDTKDSTINISSVINESIQNNIKALNYHGIEIQCDIKDMNVRSGILLIKLFDNLIQNSINHSQCKRISIITKDEADKITVLYSDDGKGIKEELLQYLFKKGFNGERRPGFGYGTYIMRKIVESYDGTIEHINSELGGLGFKITLKR
ncbi:MAG: response regulator [Candidatus Hodarchaeales archaeon]